MSKFHSRLLAVAIASASVAQSGVAAESIEEALQSGKVSGDIRLRYETVDQDNNLKDADALTVRTFLGYTTGTFANFSATLEFEDSRNVLGMDDYNSTQNGNGQYSVIADPETTELDQAYIQYKTDMLNAKLGRQVLTYDNHRFIGHVGWRQDRLTFDGVSLSATPVAGLTINYAFLDERNMIFADARDQDSKDHLVNIAYKTPIGTLTGYSYMLEREDLSVSNSLDTVGIRFAGSQDAGDLKIIYAAEFASQESEVGSADFEADYMLLEGGVAVSGITATLGYEVLGSDDGAYGFSTPLATLHKFNGWADQFLATPAEGLVDMYVSVAGSLGGGKWAVVYHEFEADDASAAVDDLGDELNISYARGFGKHYSAGIKYAAYTAGDIKVDTDKLWVWVGAKF